MIRLFRRTRKIKKVNKPFKATKTITVARRIGNEIKDVTMAIKPRRKVLKIHPKGIKITDKNRARYKNIPRLRSRGASGSW